MPKKAKKSLGRTEEERLVQLQHRAQAEEEMSKKKEEMLTLFLKVNRIYHERASNLLQGRAGTEHSIIELTSASQPPNTRRATKGLGSRLTDQYFTGLVQNAAAWFLKKTRKCEHLRLPVAQGVDFETAYVSLWFNTKGHL